MPENAIPHVQPLQTTCEILVDACDATYIAIPEQTLSELSPLFYVHLPVRSNQAQSPQETVNHHLRNVESVRYEAHTMRLDVRYITYHDAHAFGRVVLYANGHPGLEDTSIAEGIEAARRYINGEVEVTRPPSTSIELGELVDKLAAEGAGAVELRNTPFIEWSLVDLRIPMVPATGKSVTGPYTHVTIDGDKYSLNTDFSLDGPGGYGTMRTPLYIDEDIHGLSPLSRSEGMSNLETVLEISETFDSTSEAFQRLRELNVQ